MTDCSSIQGSTSSSSDAMSSRGGSNNSAASGGSGNSRIRVIRMIRPNSRRIILGPENCIGFGFAIRGGKEFSTGFFVSKVDKGSEADVRGLRVGDQIIRVNGYHVDDAVHKELTQFVSSQDRLTLKVRGVGMIPIKEKTLDPLTWHIVPRHALATTLTAALDEHMHVIGKDVRIVLKVAPKTKLGLGICKGPEWKPGIFVQFTKDFSVAREAGLRPGDQILTCNSIDFSDVLFSEAVAVMKSSNILEMIVRTGAGLDLFPGESSGYNSSASSVTGDQSPCWADQSAKRLSMVREEPVLSQTRNQWVTDGNRTNLDRRKTVTGIPNSALNQIIPPPPRTSFDESNKTIIQLSDNGTLINNTIISSTTAAPTSSTIACNVNNQFGSQQLLYNNNDTLTKRSNNGNSSMSRVSSFITPDRNVTSTSIQRQNGTNEINDENGKHTDICFVSRQSETKTVIVEVHRSDNDEKLHSCMNDQQKQQQQNATAQQKLQRNYNDYKGSLSNGNSSNEPIYGKIQPKQQHQQQQQQSKQTIICPKPPPMMPLSAITNRSNTVSSTMTKTQSYLPSAAGNNTTTTSSSSSTSRTPSIDSNGTTITTTNGRERSSSISSSIISSGGTSLSSAIEEELRKRKERLSQNPNQKPSIDESVANFKQQQLQKQQQQTNRIGNPILGGKDARHFALMDEFKAAHRRMFRNGIAEVETERQEDLKHTTIMRDEADHRSPPPPTPPKIVANHKNDSTMLNGNGTNGHHNNDNHYSHHQQQHSTFIENGTNGFKTENGNGNHITVNGNGHLNGTPVNGVNGTNGHYPTPPPPPQFANKPMGKKIFASINAFNAANQNGNHHKNGHSELQRTLSENYETNSEVPPNIPPPPPPPLPESPIPDYDSIASTPVHTLTKHNQYKHTNGSAANISTLGRVAASERAKANGDMAELESIDSYQMLNPASPTPKPPSAYFAPPNSGPPTMKKSNRPVSVTIGEYGASKLGGRKEPGKFDFIPSRSGSNSPSDLNSPMSPMSPVNGKDENVTHMLRSELELTLSRSNLKKRHDIGNTNGHGNSIVQYNNGVYQNGTFQHNGFETNDNNNNNNVNGHQNGYAKLQNGSNNRNIAYQSNNGHTVSATQNQQIINKHPMSSNVEKITNMLQNMNGNGNGGIYESSATLNGDKNLNNNTNISSARVTISLPNNNNNISSSKIELRKSDSNSSTASSIPSNGILKNSINGFTNGSSRNSFDKSITFGN